MTIEAEARLTLNNGRVRIVKFDMPLPYQTGTLTRAIEGAGVKLRNVRKALVTY